MTTYVKLGGKVVVSSRNARLLVVLYEYVRVIYGLQTLVKEKYSVSEILLAHCFAHRLNLILYKSVKCIKQYKVFLNSVGVLFVSHKIFSATNAVNYRVFRQCGTTEASWLTSFFVINLTSSDVSSQWTKQCAVFIW